MMLGCKKGDDYQCHFVKGSEMAYYRMGKIDDTLKQLSLEPERVVSHEVAITDIERLPGYRFVDYRGFLSREQVADVLAGSQAGLVVPLPYSHNMQGFMNKLFEYLSAGLPVVASDFPRWRPIVAENDCGLMVDSREPRAIADAILTLLSEPERAAAMGARGRLAVERNYNWESEKEILLDLYRSLLG